MFSSKSPTVTQEATKAGQLSFPQAIEAVIIGKKIHKLEWKDRGIYGFLNNQILSLHKEDGKNYQWILNDGDLLGDDWIVL
jgi:hypothetical protein